MKMATKSGTRAKTAVKPVKKAVKKAAGVKKPVKKRSAAAKTVTATSDKPRRSVRTVVPVADIEVMAAEAVKNIKASKRLSATYKAKRLKDVARTLEEAKERGGLVKCCVAWLKIAHRPPTPMRNILRIFNI